MEYMRYYETLYLVRPDLEAEQYKDVIEKYNEVITKNGGIVLNVDEWGKRPLAYDVRKFKEGAYVLVKFCGGPDLPDKLQREFRLDERVLKFIVVKLKDRVRPEDLKQADMTSETKEEARIKDAASK